jgi:hypothetical protein
MLKVTQAPQGPVLVKQQFLITGIASTSYAGRTLTLIADGQFSAPGPVVAADGLWQVQFLFQQPGNRRLKIAIDNDSVELPILVVTTLPEGYTRVRFLTPPRQVVVNQATTLIGEADNYPDGAVLLLRADQRFELARPVVRANKWQAPIVLTQTGRRLIEIIGEGQDTAQIFLEVVARLPQPSRLRFTTVPDRIQTGQTVVVAGEADDYRDGTQLLLRVDKTYEIARPTVQAGRWQAPIAFNFGGNRLLEIIGSEQDRAEARIEVVTRPQPRPPRVSFVGAPTQVKAEDNFTIGGNAENYAENAQLVLRADGQIELARPQVKNGKWQSNILLRQPGRRLLEIIGSEQDKAATVITVAAPASDLRLFARSTWTSIPTPVELPNFQPLRITLHHTALGGAPSVNATQGQEFERMRLIYSSHVNGNGWSDIGYHFIVMPSGRAYAARSERKRGAHDVINDGLGIAFDGIYSNRTISAQQFDAAIGLCTVLCKRYGITNTVTPVPTATADFGTRNLPRIIGHRDRVSTECPGSPGGTTVRLAEIRQAVNARL